MNPLKKISPTVITSRAASKEFERIKGRHADILTGLTNQKMRVDAQNQQKATEMQNQQVMKNDIDKAKMVNDTTANKDAMDFALRQSEIDIKRAALSQT